MNLFGLELDTNTLIMILIGVVLFSLAFTSAGETAVDAAQTAAGYVMPQAEGEAAEAEGVMSGAESAHDLGMYNIYNPNAFGTTHDSELRWETNSVRKEYNGHNQFPLNYGCKEKGDCKNSQGIPAPGIGHSHVCLAGPPNKRVVDMYGGNFNLPHICAPASGKFDAPSQLGRWFRKKGCAAPDENGLNLRSICTRCS